MHLFHICQIFFLIFFPKFVTSYLFSSIHRSVTITHVYMHGCPLKDNIIIRNTTFVVFIPSPCNRTHALHDKYLKYLGIDEFVIFFGIYEYIKYMGKCISHLYRLGNADDGGRFQPMGRLD